MRFIAFHAHATFPCVHGSGSSFRRGVYIVGHSADFRLKEGSVRAAEIGTGCKYGAGRFRSSGSCGGSAVVLRRRLVRSPCFRMRFRCPSSGPSSPACFNHLGVKIRISVREMVRYILEECCNVAWIWYVDDPRLD